MNTEEYRIDQAPLEAPAQDKAAECTDCSHKASGSAHFTENREPHRPSLQPSLKKPKVAFLCVHNSCRSQIAEALGKHLAGDVFESFSAGTEPGARINPDAVCLMKQGYGIDMEQSQYNKPLSQLPEIDIVVTMGCNVQCPFLPCSHREDWGLDDPSGKEDGAFLLVIEQIEEKVLNLKRRIQTGAVG